MSLIPDYVLPQDPCSTKKVYAVKIAIVSHSHYPIKQPFAGGLESHTYHLTQQLQQAGHQVTLFAAIGSDETLPYVAFSEPTAIKDSNDKSETEVYRERVYLSLMHLLIRGDFDLVHNNSLHYIPPKLVSSLSVPMVSMLHTPPFERLVESFQSSLSAPNHRIIAVSNSVAQSWINHIPHLQPYLIYNGVDTTHWLPSDRRKDYAIWVGRITPEKGLHLAIAAAHRANIQLKICGPIYNTAYFLTEIEPLLNRQAVYLGNLNTQALARQVAEAQVFVCTPCWDEPFGLVVAEALACGTPVAGFARGALLEILTPETGILVSENVEALAQAIAQAQYLSRTKCRKRAVEQFSMTVMIQRYIELYKSLLNNSFVDKRVQPTPTLPLVS